ncbi:hypothetical protein [Xenophilus sp. Marseille-Q4582]|uniref:hypothetical protein n=1 Tax=Xenophilus sp. Marseille-Q4582 TaxID=2866600 RepID=UPI001CE4468A|nr:hypothetical protein [Xenophilus sp. Marseille-Q4582]
MASQTFPSRRPGFVPRLAATLALASLAMACSPVFNWREVPLDGQVKALLPCKPDRAERELPLAPEGLKATIGMAGCMAGGATFAVAQWPGLTAEEAPERLKLWQRATRAQWERAIVQASEAPMAAMAVAPPAQHWLLLAEGDAAPPLARMRWFARADAQGRVTLYQATVLGEPSAADAAATFFDGLQPR